MAGMDAVDGRGKSSKSTYVGRQDPDMLTGQSGLFTLCKRVNYKANLQSADENWDFTQFSIDFFNDPLSDPNYLMMLAMTMGTKKLSETFKRPKVEIISIMNTFSPPGLGCPEGAAFSEGTDSLQFAQAMLDCFDESVIPQGVLFKTRQPPLPSAGVYEDDYQYCYKRVNEGGIKIFDHDYYVHTTTIKEPEAEPSIKVSKVKSTTEGEITGEIEEDVVCETEQDEDAKVNADVLYLLSETAQLGNLTKTVDFTDGAGHGQFLKGSTIMVQTAQIAGRWGEKAVPPDVEGRLEIKYRVHYVKLMEDEINRLIEEQNNDETFI